MGMRMEWGMRNGIRDMGWDWGGDGDMCYGMRVGMGDMGLGWDGWGWGHDGLGMRT